MLAPHPTAYVTQRHKPEDDPIANGPDQHRKETRARDYLDGRESGTWEKAQPTRQCTEKFERGNTPREERVDNDVVCHFPLGGHPVRVRRVTTATTW